MTKSDWPQIVRHVSLLEKRTRYIEDGLDRSLSYSVSLVRIRGRSAQRDSPRGQHGFETRRLQDSLAVGVQCSMLAHPDFLQKGAARQVGKNSF